LKTNFRSAPYQTISSESLELGTRMISISPFVPSPAPQGNFIVPLRRGPPKLKPTSGLKPLDFGALYRPRRVPRTQFPSSEMASVTDSGRKGEPDGRDRVKVHSPAIDTALTAAGFTAAGSDLARGTGLLAAGSDLARGTGLLAAGSDLATGTGLLAAGGGWEAGGVVGGA